MNEHSAISISPTSPLSLAGQIANENAAAFVFADYRSRKAANTRRRQDADLQLFTAFLKSAGVPAGNFAADPEAWRGVTWGLVEAFVKWQLMRGYAVESVNVRLSTVKSYAKLAVRAGVLDVSEYAMLRTIAAYSHKESKRLDEQRTAEGLSVRVSTKKANPTHLTDEQAARLLDQPGTPRGIRDTFLLCLMLEHGLRVGEVAGLSVSDFDLTSQRMTFFRPKVDKTQTHRLTPRTLQAAIAYFQIAPPEGVLWENFSVRAMNKRVEYLGRQIGAEKLSPHCLRHYWATRAARNGTPIKNLQEAGGWNSPAMPLHYIEAEQVANDGVRVTP